MAGKHHVFPVTHFECVKASIFELREKFVDQVTWNRLQPSAVAWQETAAFLRRGSSLYQGDSALSKSRFRVTLSFSFGRFHVLVPVIVSARFTSRLQ